jgi:hypothetical protein
MSCSLLILCVIRLLFFHEIILCVSSHYPHIYMMAYPCMNFGLLLKHIVLYMYMAPVPSFEKIRIMRP